MRGSRNIGQIIRRESGDTLIEVVFALSILAVVLTSTVSIATKAFRVGQTAKERTQITEAAQTQMEALRGFRDNHTWDEFLTGDSTGTLYEGVLTGSAPSTCKKISPCFHLAIASTGAGQTEYVPQGGQTPSTIPGSYIEIALTQPPMGLAPKSLGFTVSYGFQTLGGGPANEGHIQTELANVSSNVVGAVAPPGGGALFGSPPSLVPGPGIGTELIYDKTVINKSPIAPSQVAGCLWNWGDGTTTSGGCIPGNTFTHSFPTGVTANYTIVLTERAKNGAVGTFTQVVHIPNNILCKIGPSDPKCK